MGFLTRTSASGGSSLASEPISSQLANRVTGELGFPFQRQLRPSRDNSLFTSAVNSAARTLLLEKGPTFNRP